MKGNISKLQTLLTVGLALKAAALVAALVFSWPMISDGPTLVLAQAQTDGGQQIPKAKEGQEPAQVQPQQGDQAADAAAKPADDAAPDAPAAAGGAKEPGADPKAQAGAQPSQLDSRIAQMVEQKQRELALEEERIARERTELTKLRKEVDERIAELKKVQAALETLVVTERQERRKRIMQLVKVLSNMRPNSAGAVVAKLDDQMAVEIFSFMQSRQAGKVMANLDPEKAARISLLLTRKKEAEEARRIAGEAAAKAAAPK